MGEADKELGLSLEEEASRPEEIFVIDTETKKVHGENRDDFLRRVARHGGKDPEYYAARLQDPGLVPVKEAGKHRVIRNPGGLREALDFQVSEIKLDRRWLRSSFEERAQWVIRALKYKTVVPIKEVPNLEAKDSSDLFLIETAGKGKYDTLSYIFVLERSRRQEGEKTNRWRFYALIGTDAQNPRENLDLKQFAGSVEIGIVPVRYRGDTPISMQDEWRARKYAGHPVGARPGHEEYELRGEPEMAKLQIVTSEEWPCILLLKGLDEPRSEPTPTFTSGPIIGIYAQAEGK